MKFKAALIAASAIAASALVAGTAVAGDNSFYVGAGVGVSQISLPKSDITNGIAFTFDQVDFPLETWSARTDDSAIMWSAFVGYRFLKYFAVEAGYLDTGSASYTGRGTAFDIVNDVEVPATATFDWKATGGQASVLGIWPIDDNWDVFGRVGGFFGDVSGDAHAMVDTGVGKSHFSESSNEFLYGIGVDGRFLENWAARFEWLAISDLGNSSTGEADWNAFQFALLYRF